MSERDCSHCRNHTDDGCKKWKCEYVPNDLIKRQDAINAISTWDKFGVDERNRVVRWHEGLEPYVKLRDVVWAIEKLSSAERWIPCSERLPEENGQYLITVKYVHVDGYDDIYAEHGEWADGKWHMFMFGHCGKVENIIAWMPLPEPYEEDEA